MEQTPFEICKNIQRIILNRASEVIEYASWGSDFAVEHLRKLPPDLRNASWFKPIDPTQFTMEELKGLGFSRWSEEDPMMLIPLWLLPFLVEEFPGGCINGDRGILKRSELDNDNRYGCLAYGVYTDPQIQPAE